MIVGDYCTAFENAKQNDIFCVYLSIYICVINKWCEHELHQNAVYAINPRLLMSKTIATPGGLPQTADTQQAMWIMTAADPSSRTVN